MTTRLADYDFELPPELIAQTPVADRTASRLIVVDRARQSIEHRQFSELPGLLKKGDVLVANNTEVIRARLLGQRVDLSGQLAGKIEFLLLEELEPRVWEGAFHASAKHRPGVKFRIPTPDGQGLNGELIRGASESPQGLVVARFDRDPVESGAGVLPLPPYIDRAAEEQDLTSYQTVYASRKGSAAAPTAGLHFTNELIARLGAQGIDWEELTLHVGLGTFRPVKTDDIREHPMHEERYELPAETAHRLESAREAGRRLIAVGTTSVRTLESAWDGSRFRCGWGRTSLFLYPGGPSVRVVGGLVTNFHLPRSTLFMLVCALGGTSLMREAYRQAIEKRYRFFSYGDAMLIL